MSETLLNERAHGQTWPSRLGGAATAVASSLTRHPTIAVVASAALSRAVVTTIVAVRPDFTVPDEGQYVGLATSVAHGHGAEAWFPGYGQSLYDSTYVFSALLARLFSVFGAHQYVGQVVALVFGVATAGLTVTLALRVLPRPWALAAGLFVALLPSQVLWSSVVLRESMVWTACAASALVLTVAAGARSWRTLGLAALLFAAALMALGHLRQLVLLIVIWSALVAMFAFRPRRRLAFRAGVAGIAVAATLVSGVGPLGYGLVAKAFPQLGVKRLNLSIGADTSIVHDKAVPVPTPGESTATSSGKGPTPTGPAPTRSGQALEPSAPPGTSLVRATNGKVYAVDDNSTDVALHALPGGLVAVALRPFPWEHDTSAQMSFAQLENVVWFVLYALALVGAWAGWRRRDVLAFPAVFILATVAVAAVTQGNLGTAFRHRAEILWALVIFAAFGLRDLVDRYRARRSATA